MKKGIIVFVGLMVLLGLVAFVIAEVSGTVKGEQSVKLYKGWNLVSIYSIDTDIFENREYSSLIESIENKGIKAIFFYDKYNTEYIQIYPHNSQKERDVQNFFNNMGDPEQGGDIGEYGAFVNSAMWIYSNKEQVIRFTTLDGPLLLENVNLKSGWNFLAITPEFQGKTFGELKGSCNMEKAYGWAYGRESWEEIKSSQTFNEADVLWNGMIVKVSNNCNMGDSSNNGGNPPGLPEDEVCTDSDGENIFTKGIVISQDNKMADRCKPGDYTTVIEAICKNNHFDFVMHECPIPTKCLDGVCIKSLINCFDSDGGKEYFIKGEVSGFGLDTSTSAGWDHCNGDDLFEKYCENNALGIPPEKYSCPNGCQDGACII